MCGVTYRCTAKAGIARAALAPALWALWPRHEVGYIMVFSQPNQAVLDSRRPSTGPLESYRAIRSRAKLIASARTPRPSRS